MIGVDANILVRAFLNDEPHQARLSQDFLRHASTTNTLFISSYALLELAWVLKIQKFTRQEIYDALMTLLDSPGITIGGRSILLAALEKYKKGKADFGDYMILSEGESHRAKTLKTFDRAFLQDDKAMSL